MAHLELQDLTRRFEGLTALDRLSLEVAPGEILTLLGPSGCGKTTTIRLIAGFLQPSAGKILVNGRDIGPIPPKSATWGWCFNPTPSFHTSTSSRTSPSDSGLGALQARPQEARWNGRSSWWNFPRIENARSSSSAAASNSGWPWPAPWPSNRRSCFWTNR